MNSESEEPQPKQKITVMLLAEMEIEDEGFLSDEAIENLEKNRFSNLRIATPNELIKDNWINDIILRLKFATSEHSFTNHQSISKFLE